jgi:acid phosphatase
MVDLKRAALAAVLIFAGCVGSAKPVGHGTGPLAAIAAVALPAAPKHIVIIFEENRDVDAIIGSKRLPVIHSMIAAGTLFTHSRAVTHPSLPNYFAIFTGTTNSDGDHCSDKPTDSVGDLPVNAGLSARMPTLASELASVHRTFVGYAESLPSPGYVGCYGGGGSLFSIYYKRHVPWAFFTKAGHPGEEAKDVDHYLLDDSVNQTFDAFPKPGHYDDLPTVAMVTPNVKNDMHGTPLGNNEEGLDVHADQWLGNNIMPLVQWASDPKNDTLVILTWDEADKRAGRPDTNDIVTVFVGSMVRAGTDPEPITHYSVLSTIERFYGLAPMTENDKAVPIVGCWK